jgi:hypothetical protein
LFLLAFFKPDRPPVNCALLVVFLRRQNYIQNV